MTYVNKVSQIQVMPRYDLVSDPDYQILEVDLPGEAFYIIHIYNEKPLIPSLMHYTVQQFLNLKVLLDKPFILLGDFNLHHQLWNPLIQTTNPLSNSLVEYLELNDAQLINSASVVEEFGGTFHRSNSKTTSIIDLTFVAGFKQIKWQDWNYGESTGSDHELITYMAQLPDNCEFGANNYVPNLATRLNIKKANWKLFHNKLHSKEILFNMHLDSAIQEEDYDQINDLMQQLVQRVAIVSIPILRMLLEILRNVMGAIFMERK